MRIGEARAGRAPRGFTYIGLLLAVAMGAAALAALGSQWHTRLQRERETELIFRGRQIAEAIARYRTASGDAMTWPKAWADLLEDRRGPEPRHHLRRLWTDPFTGQPDWVVVRDEDGGMRGVRSRVELPAFITHDMQSQADGGASASRPQISERMFLAPLSVAASAASAASAAAE